MEEFVINPENYRSEYIKNLNQCFNGWGGNHEYDWVFNRKIGRHSSDILLIRNEEDGVIAGSGVSYRTLKGKEVSVDIGIMTGSWTLPAARKKGCFTKMIHCSKDLCKKNDVPFLTAFVTSTNPSSRRLEAEGSYMLPTYHLFSPEILFEDQSLSKAEVAKKEDAVYKQVYSTMQERQSHLLNFSYSFNEFVGQYLERIKDTTILKINDDYAVLENGVNEVKVLLLTYSDEGSLKENVKAVANWCLNNKRLKAFFFTTRNEFNQVGEELGFEISPGYFTILSSSGSKVVNEKLFSSLNINMADKM